MNSTLLLASLAAAQVVPPAPEPDERLTVDGYLRTRAALFYNLDLDHGPTPSTGEPLFPISPSGADTLGAADLRLRVDATYQVVPEVRVHVRVDGLDNVALGGTPVGLPADRWAPSIYATRSQAPGALALKRAWGEAVLPFGVLMVGRMGMPRWGVGMLADPGDGLDQDVDEDVDRLGFATSLAEHFVGISWDINASGPTAWSWGREVDLDRVDDVGTLSASLFRLLDPHAVDRRTRAGTVAWTYGAYVTWRRQRWDVPSYWLDPDAWDGHYDVDDLVERRFRALASDVFVQLDAPSAHLAVEAAYISGSIGDLSLVEGISADEVSLRQWGAVAEGWWEPGRGWRLGAEVAVASGDDAPGFGVAPPLSQVSAEPGDLDGPQLSVPTDSTIDNFRFSPNHHLDLILWRRIVGTVTDAVVVRPQLRWRPCERLDLGLALVHSRALQAASTPGADPVLGTELDLEVGWDLWHGLRAEMDYGLLLPGAGFRNLRHDLDPTPAQAAQLLLAWVY